MSVTSIQSSAESRAIELIEALRKEIIVKVVSANVASSHDPIRYQVRDLVASHMDYIAAKFHSYYVEAWNEGIAEGSMGFSTPSAIPMQIGKFEEITGHAFKSLKQSIESDTLTFLSRAALGSLSKTDVLDKIGAVFSGYAARATGIVSYEINQIAAFAQNLRAIEVRKSLGTAIIAKGDVWVFLTEWRHSGLGSPPRANHVAMDGKAVIAGNDFDLEMADGVHIMTSGPHSPNLPPGEVFGCRCTSIDHAFKVKPAAKARLEELSKRTGGIPFSEWKRIAGFKGL